MVSLLSRVTNFEKVASYDEGSTNAQAGKNNMKLANKTPTGPMKVMISPSIPKVNLPHLAYFDTDLGGSHLTDFFCLRGI
jgi:hypothetical protein